MATRRANLLLLGVTLTALLGILAIALPSSPFYQSPKLGLDLQGGLEIVLRAVPPKEHDSPKTTWTARSRSCGRASTSSASASRRSASRARIRSPSSCPGISDPQAAADLVGKTAQLWLFDLQKNILEPTAQSQGLGGTYPAPMDNLFQLLSSIQPQTKQGTPEEYYLVDPKAKKVSSGPRTRRSGCEALAGARAERGKKFPKRFKSYGVPANRIILTAASASGTARAWRRTRRLGTTTT